jgi:hypothetical protein
MSDPKQELTELHRHLGYKSLNRFWAKLEIVFGLGALGVGLRLLPFGLAPKAPNDELLTAALGIVLFVLGGYLAMAGHRSHLYQSNNELTAYLLSELRPPHPKEPA